MKTIKDWVHYTNTPYGLFWDTSKKYKVNLKKIIKARLIFRMKMSSDCQEFKAVVYFLSEHPQQTEGTQKLVF